MRRAVLASRAGRPTLCSSMRLALRQISGVPRKGKISLSRLAFVIFLVTFLTGRRLPRFQLSTQPSGFDGSAFGSKGIVTHWASFPHEQLVRRAPTSGKPQTSEVLCRLTCAVALPVCGRVCVDFQTRSWLGLRVVRRDLICQLPFESTLIVTL